MALTGCASIISGSTQEVTLDSNPDSATVTVNGRVMGKTPLTTAMKKKSGQTLVFTKDGYKPVTMQLETRMNGWFWGNIVLGGLIGSTTDGLSGAVNEYSPSQHMVSLTPEGSAPIESQTAMSPRQKSKEFIVIAGYQKIVTDITAGHGEYLDSLYKQLEIPPEAQADALKKLRALSDAYTNIPGFADRAIDLFQKK